MADKHSVGFPCRRLQDRSERAILPEVKGSSKAANIVRADTSRGRAPLRLDSLLNRLSQEEGDGILRERSLLITHRYEETAQS